MNQGIFRLVFSKVLNMYVPASEAVNARGGKGRDKRVRKLVKKAFVIIFIGSTPYVLADSPQGLKLNGATGASISNTTATSITIQQTVPKAILDWRQLNLKAGELLRFDQLGNRGWSALNRINDIAPSQIFGTIKADGNLYLINPNGIIFGSGSQVDVGGSLYAGSLDITDELFKKGLLSDPENPVFSATGGYVMVEEGAHLFTESGGRIVLLAPDVENHGLIETPDGQTILAAGEKVYLQALTTETIEQSGSPFADENPAHLLIEVEAGGEAKNLGKILADRGNISMVGLAVKQDGIVSASTSVRAGGSVTLLAREAGVNSDGVPELKKTTFGEAVNYIPEVGGKVTLGKNSVTEVRVEVNDTEEVTLAQLDTVPLEKSKITISGSDVEINGKVIANSGEVDISNGPSSNSNNIQMDRVYLGENSVIDVSGIDAIAPMERNQLEIELFSDQLKDVPLLRDSDVFKEKVFVDKRKGTALTDTTPFEQLKTKTIGEILTKGGKVTLGGEVIQREGSIVDVSGGSTTYEAGVIRETALTYNGKQYLISEIDPNTTLPAVSDQLVVSNEKWGTSRVWDLNGRSTKNWGKIQKTSALDGAVSRNGVWQAGYKEGDDAGEITHVDSDEFTQISAFAVMDGTVLANTYVGETQRLPGLAPLGGKIALTGNFAPNADKLADTFTFDTEYDQSGLRKFSTDFIKNGFNRIALNGDVNTKLSVAPNGSVSISGVSSSQPANINADIDAPDSNITISGANIANGVSISSAGNFTNDRPAVASSLQALAVNAGNIDVSVINGSIGENVKLDASAGAFVDVSGQLYQGEAGDISVKAQGSDVKQSTTYQAYGFDRGGSLSLDVSPDATERGENTGNVNIGYARENDVNLSAGFFQQGGFSSYDVTTVGDVTVGDGSTTNIYSTMQTLRTDTGLTSQASQRSTVGATSIWSAPAFQRQASAVSLTSSGRNELVLSENASITTDVGGKVNLSATNKMAVLGDINTPAGEVNLELTAETTSSNEGGYQPNNGIFIGENADLLAKGVYQQLPSNNGLLNAQVLNGGAVNIIGANTVGNNVGVGSVVVKEGAQIDVSGTSGQADIKYLTGVRRETLYGDAGSITIASRDGMLLDGSFKGRAVGSGRGGTLTLRTESVNTENDARVPAKGTDFLITQSKRNVADGLNYGDDYLPSAITTAQIRALEGSAQLSVEQIENGGFDNLAIQNSFGNKITLEAGTKLVLDGTLNLAARQIAVEGNGQADVTASHLTLSEVAFVNDIRVNNSAPRKSITTGDNALNLNADQILIRGEVDVANVNSTSLNAKYDINGSGVGNTLNQASLTSSGTLNLTARQIYPNTGNKLAFEATGDDSRITVSHSGEKDAVVLSAQGELSLKADYIDQKNGRLKAPFGTITLDANKKLTLGEGSTTSVSSDGAEIPFAVTELSGKEYVSTAYKGGVTQEPLNGKSINLKSDVVDQQEGAVIDVSGGGDMFAYEFIPGLGGSEDVLAKEGYFAVLPSLGSHYAPVDSVYQDSSSSVSVGETVYLTGIPGLKSGTYTKLPARYALMEGAYLVKEGVSADLDRGARAQQLDGSYYTTGYNAELATGARDANWSNYQVVSGAIFRSKTGTSKAPSEYLITSAKDFFGQQIKATGVQQQLPQDAGKLSIETTSQLNLAGRINTDKDTNGKGAQVDIASENIRVVAEQDSDTSSLQLTAAKLNDLNAESLLLGGRRDVDGNSTKITALSQTVTIENNIENSLKLPELIATSKESVTVKSGASVVVQNNGQVKGVTDIETTGDGALLAVSGINDITYSRTGSSAAPTQGDLTIEAGANIQADQSVVIDATKDSDLSGTVKVADGGSATFGANRILLGTPSPAEQGLIVSNQTLADLGQLAKFSLNSQNNVDVYGNVDFGNADLDLTINSAGIAGNVDAGESVNITARNFELNNDNNASYTAPTNTENGDLNITAANVKLKGTAATNTQDNAGKTTLGNFANVTINADELRVSETGQTTFDSTTTNLNTGRITADTGADYTLSSNQTLTTAELATPVATDDTDAAALEGIGASLAIEADQLNVGGNIEVAAGNLALTSTQDLNIASGANLSAKSTNLSFNQVDTATPAGKVTLQSETGNVNLATGATVDVSAAQDAKAGAVNIVATNDGATANIQGSLIGTDEQGDVSGSLNIDVNKLADLTTTNQQASGFGGERRYRIRNEANVEISGKTSDGTALSANKISVTNDGGAITVSGDIDATSQKSGRIDLAAKDDVTLLSGASLTAKSTGEGAEGGTVTASTQQGRLDFEAGSNIDVSGGEGGEGGDVLARAPLGNITTSIQSTVVGAKKRQFAGFAKIQKETVTQADIDPNSPIRNIVDPWMQSIQGIDKNGFNFVPEIVAESDSDLTVTGNISLYDWRYDPDTGAAVANNATGKNANGNNLLAGILTLQAKGDVTIDGSLNDGFDADGEVSGHDSASFNVVAGADLDSADQLAVTHNNSTLTIKNAEGGTGGVECPSNNPLVCALGGFLPPGVKPTLSTPTGIRTGTGDINIASSGDVNLANDNSVIYTAGRKADDLAEFTAPEDDLKPLYLTDGGNITLNVKGNVTGQEATNNDRQVVNQWLFRQGGGTENGTAKDTSWWVRPDLFKQSLATFGGGNVVVNSGGNIENFSASVATSGRFDSNGTSGNQRIDGGGDLTIHAGGNIVNGTYFVAKGEGDITTGGSLKKSGNVGTVIAMQDSTVNVTAGKDSEIETVVNPTLFAQSSSNVIGPDQTNDNGVSATFNTFGVDSTVSVSSLTGDISLSGAETLTKLDGLFITDLADRINGYYPGTVNATAFGGDVTIKDIRMLPAANGNLSILANNDINIGNILMSDADLTLFPNPLRPVKRFGQFESEINAIAGTPVHINDETPAKIVAQYGSILRDTSAKGPDIRLAKSVIMYAGQDIDNFSLKAQNLRASDVTIVKAGNDINGFSARTSPTIEVAGPGQVYVEAGRNIDLGVSDGITTIGNKDNPALSQDAASITVIAGLGEKGATIDAYIDQYILPTGAGPSVLQGDATALQTYRKQTANALTDYIRSLEGDNTLTDEAALTLFADLSQEHKMIFVNRHLSNELRLTGKAFPTTGSYKRGFDAIATLFPAGAAQGDINLFESKISAARGGSVDMLAPNGLINVGLAGGSTKTDIGITTDEAGDEIRIYADQGLEVNLSKVVSKQAGDLTIWVNNGDVDAGRGSKAATSAPERTVRTDVDGNTTITTVGVAAGSGIQAQSFDPDGPGPRKAPDPGEVVIVAPRGTIDAGEAGIAGGNVFVIAPVIANAANISASGSTTGVPAAATNVAAAVGPGADSSTQNAVQEVAQNVAQDSSAPVADDLFPSLITGRFLGFGDEE